MASTEPDSAVTRVDLLRHGECQGGDIFRGVTDSPLTDQGWQQMRRAVEGDSQWQHIVCSPLQRCRLFAEQLSQRLDTPFSQAPGLREIDFGVWEGQRIADVWQREEKLIGQYFSDPGSVTPTGGEALADARERVIAAWQTLLHTHRGQRLLVVAHGGTIRLLLAHLLSMPLSALARLSVPHGSRSQLEIYHQPDGDYPSLVSHNPTAITVEQNS